MPKPRNRDALMFRCPTCGSRPLRKCVTKANNPFKRFHVARTRSAAWTWGGVVERARQLSP